MTSPTKKQQWMLCVPFQLDTIRKNAMTPSIHFLSIYWALLLSHLVIPFKKIKPAIFFSVTALLSSHFGVRRLRIAGLCPLFKKKSGYDGVVTENTSTARHFFLAASEKSCDLFDRFAWDLTVCSFESKTNLASLVKAANAFSPISVGNKESIYE